VIDSYTVLYKMAGMKSPKDMVQALLDLGLTQTKIASEAGVTQPTISRALAGNGVSYENGKKIEAYYESQILSQPFPDIPNGAKARESKGPVGRSSIDPDKLK
jgi:transcriptional regulator with XRE-family HTH domain